MLGEEVLSSDEEVVPPQVRRNRIESSSESSDEDITVVDQVEVRTREQVPRQRDHARNHRERIRVLHTREPGIHAQVDDIDVLVIK